MNLFTINELETYAEWIAQSKKGIKKPDVQILRQIDNLALAYKATISLESAITGYKPIVPTCVSMGKSILMGREDFRVGERDITLSRFKAGWHLFNVLVDNKILKLQKGQGGRDVYLISPHKVSVEGADSTESEIFLDNLFTLVDLSPIESIPVLSRPVFEAPEPFDKFMHPVGGELVRHANPDVVDYFTIENCPDVYNVINKHMSNSYVIDTELLSIYWECQDDNLFTLEDKILTKEQKDGMQMERTSVLNIATGVGDRPFWEYLFYDNRGRLYSSAVYLSHQGSKISKSLIHLEGKEPLGETGWYWLLVHAANAAGQDKIPVSDRYDYSNKRLDEWMEIANNPIEDKRWQDGSIESPFEFLATILEINRAIQSDDIFEYKSGLIVALDATCSGLQNLSAISKDEDSAKMCNIDGSKERGDYYGTIANELWKKFNYTDEEYAIFEETLPKLYGHLKRVELSKGKKRVKAIEMSKAYQDDNREAVKITSKVFWGRPEIAEKRRKIVKRPCMTYFYSCQGRTMARQLYRDFRTDKLFKGIHPVFCYSLTYKLYRICTEMMPKATKMMNLFIDLGLSDYRKGYEWIMDGNPISVETMRKRIALETIDKLDLYDVYRSLDKKEANAYFNGFKPKPKEMRDIIQSSDRFDVNPNYVKGGEDFSLIAPVTKFKMLQYYRDNITERVKVWYKDRYLTLKISVAKGAKLNYKKIINATSPNVVHMMDSQLVAKVILDSKHATSCIHDSFGTVPAHAQDLYVLTRECFHDIFEEDLLERFTKEKEFKHDIQLGSYDIKSVRKDEYFTS